jgi:hypothetical protein
MSVPDKHYTAFSGSNRIASGALASVVARAKAALEEDAGKTVLVIDEASRVVEIDFRGTLADVLERLPQSGDDADAAPPSRPLRPGRPRLGVVAREVTLLPRHWEWLGAQPGGASVALRRLVEEARRAHEPRDRARQAQETAYRFMTMMAGDLPGYEEATRALFASDRPRFVETIRSWPADVRVHAEQMAKAAFDHTRQSVAHEGAGP